MDAIHIIMATSSSANPHNAPNIRIESLARKRKISAFTFLVFGTLLIIAGSLLASFERQRFSVSFIIFGGIGIIFAFMYWISAEKILIALRKLNAERMRQARLHAQNSGAINFDSMRSEAYGPWPSSFPVGLPSYEQSVLNPLEIPPPYEEAIKIESTADTSSSAGHHSSSLPIQSISLSVDQSAATTMANNRAAANPAGKRLAPSPPSH